MLKTAVIIHGMPPKEEYYDVLSRPTSYNRHWLPWIQKQLLLKDIVAQTLQMPVPYDPEYQSWKEVFEGMSLNEDTILIGHSGGGGFILRYLSENNIKVGKVVLVAPWLDPEKSLDKGMFDFLIDENLVQKTKGLVVFNSTNDKDGMQKSVEMIKNKIKGVNIIEFKNFGHFCYEDMGTDAFPELLKEF